MYSSNVSFSTCVPPLPTVPQSKSTVHTRAHATPTRPPRAACAVAVLNCELELGRKLESHRGHTLLSKSVPTASRVGAVSRVGVAVGKGLWRCGCAVMRCAAFKNVKLKA